MMDYFSWKTVALAFIMSFLLCYAAGEKGSVDSAILYFILLLVFDRIFKRN